MRSTEAASVLYLRLPARAELHDAALMAVPLPFAVGVRGRVQRQGIAPVEALTAAISQSQRVALLLAASDVTLLRIAVPPLPASRLSDALPALVEDRIIGDAADCVLAAGPDEAGYRTVAVVDRRWLTQWIDLVRRSGARRLSALPLQLCLPLPATRIAAALLDFPHPLKPARELVLRFAQGEGTGLPLGGANDPAAAPAEVLRSLAALAALAEGKALQLSVPASELERYRDALAVQPGLQPGSQPDSHPASLPDIELRAETWQDWTEGAAQADVDLINGIASDDASAIDWQRWRLPIALAAAVLLLNVLALNGQWWQLHSEGHRLQAEMLRTYRAAFPNDSTTDEALLADPLGKMKQKRVALARAAGEASDSDFLSLASAVGEAWPALQQSAAMDARALAAIEYRDGSLQLRLKPGQRPSLDAARKVLAERRLALATAADANTWQVRSAQ